MNLKRAFLSPPSNGYALDLVVHESKTSILPPTLMNMTQSCSSCTVCLFFYPDKIMTAGASLGVGERVDRSLYARESK